jgi:hypothetical protein
VTCTGGSNGIVKLAAALLAVTVLPAAAQQPPAPQPVAPPTGEAAPVKAETPAANAKVGAAQCEVAVDHYINQADADAICPGLCTSLGGWNGHWTNLGGGVIGAVCKCHPRPKGDLSAGAPILRQSVAEALCPGVCGRAQGTWTKDWRDTPRGGWCGCEDLCQAPCRGDGYSSTAHYDSVFRKACHNCYESQYASSLDSAFNSTENIEVDFWDTENGLSGQKDDYWYVRHNLTGGNENNCMVDGVGNHGLRACLDNIKARSDRDRNHPVYTVFLDKKEDWSLGGDRAPIDLDQLVTSIFGAQLYTPADLRAGSASLRESAKADRWPAMDALRGRILLVLTGGQTVSSNKTLNEYVERRGQSAALFVAPDTDSFEDVLGTPSDFNAETAKWVVFYNIKAGDAYAAQTAYQERYVSRLWGGLEDGQAYGSYVKDCVNFIALYDFERTDFNDSRVTGVLAPQ